MTFVGLGFNCNQILDKLSGFQFAMEAMQAYQEEYGTLKFIQE
jgi:hypothetical protein